MARWWNSLALWTPSPALSEIQRQLRGHDGGGSEANPIQFRIGINVGDIIIAGDDTLGDGVNIAARIEGIAEPGGISISEDVWRQVRGTVATNFVDAGEQSLKNIARAVRIYRLDSASKSAAASEASRPMLALPDGRPPRQRDFQRQQQQKPARCHRTMVSGRTIVRTCKIDENHRYSWIKNQWSLFVSGIRP